MYIDLGKVYIFRNAHIWKDLGCRFIFWQNSIAAPSITFPLYNFSVFKWNECVFLKLKKEITIYFHSQVCWLRKGVYFFSERIYLKKPGTWIYILARFDSDTLNKFSFLYFSFFKENKIHISKTEYFNYVLLIFLRSYMLT